MGEGRGSAYFGVVSVAALLMLLSITVDAATYSVGGSSGWTFNMVSWPKGKTFRAGDTIVFNYDSTIHNVVAVNKAGYQNCRSPAGARVYKSGKDQIKLARGQNFFICSIAGHCDSGMKIAINAV